MRNITVGGLATTVRQNRRRPTARDIMTVEAVGGYAQAIKTAERLGRVRSEVGLDRLKDSPVEIESRFMTAEAPPAGDAC